MLSTEILLQQTKEMLGEEEKMLDQLTYETSYDLEGISKVFLHTFLLPKHFILFYSEFSLETVTEKPRYIVFRQLPILQSLVMVWQGVMQARTLDCKFNTYDSLDCK